MYLTEVGNTLYSPHRSGDFPKYFLITYTNPFYLVLTRLVGKVKTGLIPPTWHVFILFCFTFEPTFMMNCILWPSSSIIISDYTSTGSVIQCLHIMLHSRPPKALAHYTRNCKKCGYLPYTLRLFKK